MSYRTGTVRSRECIPAYSTGLQSSLSSGINAPDLWAAKPLWSAKADARGNATASFRFEGHTACASVQGIPLPDSPPILPRSNQSVVASCLEKAKAYCGRAAASRFRTPKRAARAHNGQPIRRTGSVLPGPVAGGGFQPTPTTCFRTGHRAFTLIELLIVVALLAIFAAASLSVITTPAEEQHTANMDMQTEAGMGLFFSTVVADMHDATTVTQTQTPAGLELSGLGGSQRAVRYWVDPRNQLRRAAFSTAASVEMAPGDGSGAPILENVRTFEGTQLPEPGRWRVRVVTHQSRFGRSIDFDRHVDVLAGHAWAGGKP
jgi:prepilin-type N-terminal cleavage/methylation domain-containing protein